MQTTRAYLEDTYLYVDYGTVIKTGMDDKGYFFILDRTIFYPQGGGQPSDQGYIEIDGACFDVSNVRMIENQILHYSNRDCIQLLGKSPKLIINHEKRLLNAKLHTSGHLISNIVERKYSDYEAVKGHHFPGECYVEFSTKVQFPKELDLGAINNEINDAVKTNLSLESIDISAGELQYYCPNLPYAISKTDGVRLIKISDFDYQPCGGTHVKSSLELKGLHLTKKKLKGNSLRISYQII